MLNLLERRPNNIDWIPQIKENLKYYKQKAEYAKGNTAEQMILKTANLEGKRKEGKLGFRGLTLVAPD